MAGTVGRAPAPPREGQGLGQDRGLGLARDVMRPSYVTGEPCEHTQWGPQACGERNLGPEPHKTGVAFTACLCCQLPPAAAIKAASSPVPVPLYGLTQCPSPTELWLGPATGLPTHRLARRLMAPLPSQPPLPEGHGAAGCHPGPQFPPPGIWGP